MIKIKCYVDTFEILLFQIFNNFDIIYLSNFMFFVQIKYL